ncbi:protein lin-52 homolog [Sycon ciliatum]|uniref:protein lin-52 homolog n=1 Tax=Sycon ciliatum TaxID=27933 RepID=UPI0031F5F6E3
MSTSADAAPTVPTTSTTETIAADGATILTADEKLDRESPELWPITPYAELMSPFRTAFFASPLVHNKWQAELGNDDFSMLQELASLTQQQLLEKVKTLQNLAYELGREEAHEATRGRYLRVLEPQT